MTALTLASGDGAGILPNAVLEQNALRRRLMFTVRNSRCLRRDFCLHLHHMLARLLPPMELRPVKFTLSHVATLFLVATLGGLFAVAKVPLTQAKNLARTEPPPAVPTAQPIPPALE